MTRNGVQGLVLVLALGGCGRSFSIPTPSGFVDLGSRYGSDESRATTPDGAVFGVRAFDNDPKGDVTFWTKAVENRLRDLGGYAILGKRAVVTQEGIEGTELRFGHDEGTRPYAYVVTLLVTPQKLFLIESAGPKDELDKSMPRLDEAVRSFHAK
jgi:hypothetical protein